MKNVKLLISVAAFALLGILAFVFGQKIEAKNAEERKRQAEYEKVVRAADEARARYEVWLLANGEKELERIKKGIESIRSRIKHNVNENILADLRKDEKRLMLRYEETSLDLKKARKEISQEEYDRKEQQLTEKSLKLFKN